jgi:hypothetical protein
MGTVHELYCTRITVIQNTTANRVDVRTRKGKVVKTVNKYWQRLWEIDETCLLEEALKKQSTEKKR